MKVLHLFSNCKWTGPAEPALNLCCALRDQGVEIEFACAPDSGNSVNMVVESARARGIEPILDFHLRKHRHVIKDFLDVFRMRRFLRKTPFDLLHCHLDNDHEIARYALAGTTGTPLVRSSYEGLGFEADRRHHNLLQHTDLLLEPSKIALRHDTEAFGLASEQLAFVPGAIDTKRFEPGRIQGDTRATMGIPDDAYVVGIVARMQTHRHFEDLLQAMRQLIDAMPNAHLVIVGRGTNQKIVVEEPARDMRIADHVHITGYVEGDDLVAAIQAMDIGVYLVPGSDGTCRAAREILSMGKPLIVADRGMLREIVVDGKSGLVTDGSADALLSAIRELGNNPKRRQAMGKNARHLAEKRYALAPQARMVKALYEDLLAR
ncbi:MAG: glycosyltransferase family 4 protein [Candidatus Hydrogenedentes bacterium]|nr:glycosyltransferase family 4 protein [Candidatus Hydrogenedentota bacterium]